MTTKKQHPTEKQWAAIEGALDRMYELVELECDGRKVTLSLRRIHGMQLGIMVYVDGWVKGSWFLNGGSEEARLFYPATRRHLWTKEQRKALRGIIGDAVDQTATSYRTYWTSAKKLRRHLVENCERITWLNEGKRSKARHDLEGFEA